mgnify:CR=1 FL=1
MKKNFTTEFFGRVRGDFNVSPQEYHRSWRNRVGAGRSFLGPWDYAGISSSGLKSSSGFKSPQDSIKGSSSVQRGGFLSPVNDIKVTKQKIYKSGANRTQALSEE